MSVLIRKSKTRRNCKLKEIYLGLALGQFAIVLENLSHAIVQDQVNVESSEAYQVEVAA